MAQHQFQGPENFSLNLDESCLWAALQNAFEKLGALDAQIKTWHK